jgi:hypothetical protein
LYLGPVGALRADMLEEFIIVAIGEFAVALYSYWERTEYIEANSLNTELTFRVVVMEDVGELADVADLLLGRGAFFDV